MRELESLALARLRRLLEDDSVPASVQLRAALAILNRPKEPLGIEEWNVPGMESLETTLKTQTARRQGAQVRHNSTDFDTFAVSDGARLRFPATTVGEWSSSSWVRSAPESASRSSCS